MVVCEQIEPQIKDRVAYFSDCSGGKIAETYPLSGLPAEHYYQNW